MSIKENTHLGMGIDTARYGHHVSFMDDEKRTAAKPFHFTENADGYNSLRQVIDRLCEKHPGVLLHIHVDAAGQYAANLLEWLHQQQWPTVISVGQPARNKAYCKAHFSKRKADPVESLACARFAIVERPDAMFQTAIEFSVLRDAVAQMEASATARTRLVNQLHNMLARAFPELAVLVNNIAAKAILNLLKKYPTAKRLAAAQLSSISKLPHIGNELAAKLHEAAKVSTAAHANSTTELLIKQKVGAIVKESQTHGELGDIVENAAKELPAGAHQRIRSIPGIGPQTEAALIAKIAKIVSIERFRSPEALIGYFGIFPEEVDVSGTDKKGTPKTGKVMRMSRKGNDLVRRLLYTAAQVAVRHNGPVRALYARQRGAGKDYNKALGHCMAKLLRQVFAVWKKDCDFDRNFETGVKEVESADASVAVEEPAQEKVVGHSQAQSPSQKVVTTTACKIAERRPAINFAELRSQVPISEVLRLIGWDGSRSGGQSALRGACPLHESTSKRSTSFAVNTEKQVYCCHSCGSQGNALDLWAASQGLSIFDAAWDLIERLGLDAPVLEKKENCTV